MKCRISLSEPPADLHSLDDGRQLVAWSPERFEPDSAARFDIDATRVSWFDD